MTIQHTKFGGDSKSINNREVYSFTTCLKKQEKSQIKKPNIHLEKLEKKEQSPKSVKGRNNKNCSRIKQIGNKRQ